MGAIVGIDFGSSACRTAVYRDGRAEPFSNRFSERRQPALAEPPSAADGDSGLGALPAVFRSLKQKTGTDPAAPGEIAALFHQLLEDAQAAVGESVERAVLTVPGFFPERPRAVLREAALRAGFPAVRLLDEALGAVLGATKPFERGTVLVYALGAGVFSATVVRVANGKPRVLSSEGHRFLGGNDFDAALMGLILDRLNRPRDLNGAQETIPRLKTLAEQVKIGLSRREQEEFDVVEGAPATLTLSRAEFELAIAPAVETTLALTRRAVESAGLAAGGIDQVLLAGGSTRIPLIERRLREHFPVTLFKAGDADIARGAALQAGQMPEADWKRNEPEPSVEPSRQAHAASGATPDQGTWLPMFSPLLLEAETLWNRGERNAAIAKFHEMLDQGKRYLGTLYHELGQALFRAEQYDEAIPYLEEALRQSPNDRFALQTYHESLNQKARALCKAGRWLDARSVIRQSLKINPHCPGCLQVQQTIDDALRGPRFNASMLAQGKRKKRR